MTTILSQYSTADESQSAATKNSHVRLLQTLHGHEQTIYAIKFAPDGSSLLSTSADKTIRLWQYPEGHRITTLSGHQETVYSAAWSPDGTQLASCSRDNTIKIWDVKTASVIWSQETGTTPAYTLAWSSTGTLAAIVDSDIWLLNPATQTIENKLELNHGHLHCFAWSPDGRLLAMGGDDRVIYVWDCERSLVAHTLNGHTQAIYTLAWSPDGGWLASGSGDKTIRIWDAAAMAQKMMLESHTHAVVAICFSGDKQLLASKGSNGIVRLWQTSTWQQFTQIDKAVDLPDAHLTDIAFHPQVPVLATHDETHNNIQLHLINQHITSALEERTPTFHYTNAKVVLMGDTGVGKSALSYVLCGQPYQDTDSTHSRRVYTFDAACVRTNNNVQEIRETLLWDLAGQPGYRLIHQLHLKDVSIALIVFDSRNEVDPFAGVIYWVKALQQSRNRDSETALPLKIFLVAARIDRGKVGVSKARIEKFMQTYGIDGYFETSARTGHQIVETAYAIQNAINWDSLPKISSTDLLQKIKDFCLTKRDKGLYLISQDSLYVDFLGAQNIQSSADLQSQFDTCISLLASQGVFERFSFGNMLLLKPELLDSYASALINAARNEPDGLGYIHEDKVLEGQFDLPDEDRIPNKAQEKLLLIATVEKLLLHEIALRVHADAGAYLVFPSQFTREHPDLKTPVGKVVKFTFEGPVLNIWATLVVRLAQSGLFQLQDMWKNGAIFNSTVKNASCGLLMREITESQAELTLFYDKTASPYSRYQFEEYIYLHLQRRTLPAALKRVMSLNCQACGYEINEEVINLRKERGYSWVACPVCSTRLVFARPSKDDTQPSRPEWIAQMDKTANRQRDRSVASTILSGKRATGDYDVFMCHNHKDKAIVKKIARKLTEYGLLPWLDEWELPPGIPWQPILEEKIKTLKAAAVFVGPSGIGPWQDMEQMGFLRQFTRRGCPVIPVVLPTCTVPPELPYFLSSMTWVDFRKAMPNPMQQLVWGITGERKNKEPGNTQPR